MAFEGACHCGQVKFSVAAEPPASAIRCNCSHCRRKAFPLVFFPKDAFTLTSGEDRLTTYRFNSCRIVHRFCSACGVQAFAEGVAPDGSETRAVNLRCVPTIDLEALAVQDFDGASR
jgi:hypothetical protein